MKKLFKKDIVNKIVTLGLVGTLALSAVGCGNAAQQTNNPDSVEQSSGDAGSDTGVKTVKIARVFTSPPYNYNDEEGKQTGFETEVVKAAFELLPQYEVEFIDTTDEDLLTGIQTGKYDLGFKTAWWTAERAETFVIPQQDSGVTTVGLLIRSEDADEITSFETFSQFSGNLVPLAPSNAQYTVVDLWNQNNPDYPIDLQPAESFDTTEAITWLLEGRYDGHIVTGHYYKNNIVDESGAYHQFADQLSFFIYEAIPTYPLFNGENQEIADAYDEAITQLKEDGTIEALELEFFGEDLYQYVSELSSLH